LPVLYFKIKQHVILYSTRSYLRYAYIPISVHSSICTLGSYVMLL